MMVAPRVFSVVIPSHGRPGRLSACLRAVLQADFPPDGLEVVVVDDGNPEELETRVPMPPSAVDVRWVRLSGNAGPAAARNTGASVARGTYLAFIDDDCLADRDWLTRLLAALEANPGAAVGGGVLNGSDGNLFCAADQTILDVAYAYYNADPSRARFFATLNLAVPAEAFRQFGGFDPSHRTSEDREFCARWLADGRGMIYASDAVVVHAATSSLGRFWRRHYAFGEGAYRFRSRHARSAGNRITLEPPAFYLRLVLAPFAVGLSARSAAVAALVALSQVASAWGFAAARLAGHTSKGRTA
jgi:GT2 family glycosyltransferase